MNKRTVRSVVTLLAVYCGLTAVAFLWGNRLLAAFLPLLGTEIDWLLPAEFVRTSLSLGATNGQAQIVLDVATTVDIAVEGRTAQAGLPASSSTLQAYALQHIALVFSILAAWPAHSLRQRAWLLALGVPCVLISVSLDIPFVLTGLLRQLWLEQVSRAASGTDALVVYYEFMHRGGRIGLAVVVALTAALAVTDLRNAAGNAAVFGRTRAPLVDH